MTSEGPARPFERNLPTVQLRHELPDGSHHVDWLIARDPAGADPLVTFRLPRRLDELVRGDDLPVLRIADHRPRYLTYEGPLSGGRGEVRNLCRGVVRRGEPAGDAWRLEIDWGEAGGESGAEAGSEAATSRQVVEVWRERDDRWIVRTVDARPAGMAE